MSKKGSVIQAITQWKIIVAIQVIASLLLVGLLFKLGALPMKYTIIAIVILVLLNIGMFFLMKPSSEKGKGKTRTVIGKVLSVLLSILLLVGSLYIAKGDSTLGSIANANTQTTRVSLVVMNDSSYKELSDLKNQTIEANMQVDKEKMDEAVKALNKEESSIQIAEQNDFDALVDDLYNGKTKAVLVNQAYYAVFEAKHENFQDEIREIWNYDIEEKIDDISTGNVDVTKDVFTVYISGIDTTGKVSTVSRSDVNMLVTVNPTTKQILMTSIPRDYYVTLANRGEKDKLTHAGIFGVENSVKTLEGLMNIKINYYARVNFTSLIKIVDALGGITVNSPVSFTTLHGKYQIVKGDNKMNGEKALGFVRERYGLSGGDNDRVKNQQRVLTAMLKKMMSPTIITNYSRILDSISGSFETNMSSSEITSLLQMQLSDMASWDIHQVQLKGKGKSMTGGSMMPKHKLYYMIPDENSVKQCTDLIKKMENHETISTSK